MLFSVKWVKYIGIISALVCLLLLWDWFDKNDYFKSNYNELTATEADIFNHNKRNGVSLAEVYEKHFSDTAYKFPRQQVTRIKLFKNIAVASVFTSKTLKRDTMLISYKSVTTPQILIGTKLLGN